MISLLVLTLLSGGALCADSQTAPSPTSWEQLVEIDRKIENLVQQKMTLKAKIGQDVEQGAHSILPRRARREDRSAEEDMEQLQALDQQLQQLEARRAEILSGLQ